MMHLNLPDYIFIEADWTLLGNVVRENSKATHLRKLALAALLHSERNLCDLSVFWTAPLQEGMLESDCDALLFHHRVDFARKMDFTRMDFHNASVLFPEFEEERPTDDEIREAKVIAHLMTKHRRHWRTSRADRQQEQNAAGCSEVAFIAGPSLQ